MEDGMTPDLQAEYDNLMRRRKIADAMLQRAQTQQPITHWTQGLAQLYNAYQGKKVSDEVASKEKELKARAAQGEQAAIEQLKQSIAGREAQILAPGEVGPPAPAMPAPREKVRQALIDAQMSQYPKLRQFGAAQQKFVEADEARSDAAQARKDQISAAAEDRLAQIRLAESERRITKKEADEREAALRRELAKLKGGAGGEGGEYGTFLPVTGPDGRVTYQFGVQKGPRSGQIVAPPSGGSPAQYSPEVQGAITSAKTGAKASAERDFNMSGVTDIIKQAESLLTGPVKPTGSGAGAVVDKAAAVVGVSPRGAAEADQLRAVAGALTSKMPRMEGPQSDRDTQLYREMAGQVGDASLPVARRLAALRQVQALVSKYDKTATKKPAGREVLDAADAILRGQ